MILPWLTTTRELDAGNVISYVSEDAKRVVQSLFFGTSIARYNERSGRGKNAKFEGIDAVYTWVNGSDPGESARLGITRGNGNHVQ